MSQALFRLITAIPMAVSALALFTLMIVTFCDVILRSIFNAPLEFAADLTRVLMAITVFAVMPLLSARGGQITVDLLDGLFERWKLLRWVNALVALGCGIILFWPAKRVFDLAERAKSYGDIMEYLRLPVHYIGWFIAAMTALTALALVWRGLALIFSPNMIKDVQND